MITNIQIKNFKSLKKVEVALGQITILVGLNGSGKSSLIQALGIMKQSLKQSQLMFNGELINLGDFNDVVSSGENSLSFFIGGQKEIDFTPFAQRRGLAEYGYEIVCDKEGLLKLTPEIKIDVFFIGGKWERLGTENSHKIEIDQSTFQYNIAPMISEPLRFQSSSMVGDRGKHQEAGLALNRLFRILGDELESITIVPAGRGLDKPLYALESSYRKDIMDSNGTSPQASHLASAIAYRSDIEEKVSDYISRITSIKIRHKLVPDKQVRIETRNGINIVNEGFGSNQLVQLFTQIESASLYSLIAIEEPENPSTSKGTSRNGTSFNGDSSGGKKEFTNFYS